jgi:hypothetical protein
MGLSVQGRVVSATELEQLRHWVGAHPEWSRYRLSRELAQVWDWRNGAGQLKDMAARALLLKLAQRGLVELPARRWASPNRHRLVVVAAPRWDTEPVRGLLSELRGLTVVEVSQEACVRAEVKAALAAYHYLGYRLPVGENLQYAVRDGAGRWLAVLVFGAAAWKCAVRDRWIGWSREQRERGLGQIANNSRFLILPWVRVAHLASWILGQVAGRISRDWELKYGHGLRLLETFVDRERFAGTSYRAANWMGLGATTGRSRQDRDRTLRVPVKEVYVYPLGRGWRGGLCR